MALAPTWPPSPPPAPLGGGQAGGSPHPTPLGLGSKLLSPRQEPCRKPAHPPTHARDIMSTLQGAGVRFQGPDICRTQGWVLSRSTRQRGAQLHSGSPPSGSPSPALSPGRANPALRGPRQGAARCSGQHRHTSVPTESGCLAPPPCLWCSRPRWCILGLRTSPGTRPGFWPFWR